MLSVCTQNNSGELPKAKQTIMVLKFTNSTAKHCAR